MNDTICAISTTPGVSAISIIRVSGSSSIKIVNSLFDGADLETKESHTIHYGHITHQNMHIDEVLLMLMKGPKTYTTEDTVEINCHGGTHTTQKIMELLLQNGCRLAEPGEFTKRAFLNGRISLLESESVNDLIVAKTDAARILAMNNVDGLLTKKIKNLREKMVQVLANIAVNIDYPEYEDEVQVTDELLNTVLMDISNELKHLVEGAKNGRIIKDGINVAIVGKPNVGKSSILNSLLDEEKAIVTNIPGTTRDIVEGSITIEGVQVNFVDTAGIRKTNDVVEKIGVDKSKMAASNADLVLYVFNNNEPVTDDDIHLLETFNTDKLIVFINKNDLEKRLDEKQLKDYKIIEGNTVSLDGLDSLKNEIKKMFQLESIVNKDMSYLSNLRQIDLINKANQLITNAIANHKKGLPIDIVELDIKVAWNFLGELIGESYQEELVDNIFSRFCLGK